MFFCTENDNPCLILEVSVTVSVGAVVVILHFVFQTSGDVVFGVEPLMLVGFGIEGWFVGFGCLRIVHGG